MAIMIMPTGERYFMPFRALRAVTPGSALPLGPCQGIIVGTAGSLNYTDFTGEILTGVPVQAGYNPICCQSIESGGTASNIWAGYH